MSFPFRDIDRFAKSYWQKEDVYSVSNTSKKPKYYVLDMFPYPSGAGLHVGHPLGYIASDIVSRYKRQKGFNVLHPMGFDAFGLPAEQYAIQTGRHPRETTNENINRYKEQLNQIGFCYDWNREIRTSDPEFYKWTQWIFSQLFQSYYNVKENKAKPIEELIKHFEQYGFANHPSIDTEVERFTSKEWNGYTDVKQSEIIMQFRLAYIDYSMVNWCQELGTVLANDEVINGKSERGGYPVERRPMRQWFLRITAYADRLLSGLEKLDWSDSMKEMQRNWIGRSEGAIVKFETKSKPIEVFTTRPDTIFGATFMVLAPEHELVDELTTKEQKQAVDEYISYVKSRTDIERQAEKKVTGVSMGCHAIHPFTGEKIPVYISEYVLIGYGTGAIMAVPSDDERDERFAEKFGIEIKQIIEEDSQKHINSDFLDGLNVAEAKKRAIEEIEKRNIGKKQVNYRLRDAGFSRQRYWGEPFPILYRKGIPEIIDNLPVTLPNVDSYKPTGDGKSPLANATDWVAEGDAFHETDTMPGYAGSSWYFLRYMDPRNQDRFVGEEAENYWQNVDLYIGGTEHAVGHLLYARFWQKFLFDLGLVSKNEPFQKLVNQGMIQGRSAYIYEMVGNIEYAISFEDLTPEEQKHQFKHWVLNFFKSIVMDKIHIQKLKKDSSNDYTCKIRDFDFIKDFFKNINQDILIQSEQKFPGVTSFEIDEDSKLVFVKRLIDIIYVKDGDVLDIDNIQKDPRYWGVKFVDFGEKFVVLRETEKMSKSKFNVVNPDDIIKEYGADVFRMFEMFLGPIEQHKPWDTKGIDGVAKFMRKFWHLFYDNNQLNVTEDEPTKEELKVLHTCIKKVTEDIERLSLNTCVSAFMIAVNEFTRLKSNKRAIVEQFVALLSPFAPHTAEQVWQDLGNTGSVVDAAFPVVNEAYLIEDEIEYPVSINGKMRVKINLPAEMQQEEAKQVAMENETVQKWIDGKSVKKFIFVPRRIINIVT